jgi:hypothetical protein
MAQVEHEQLCVVMFPWLAHVHINPFLDCQENAGELAPTTTHELTGTEETEHEHKKFLRGKSETAFSVLLAI